MNATTKRSPVRNGLKDISLEELWKNSLLLADVLKEKLQGLPVNPKKFPLLAQEVQVMQELLLAVGTRRYGKLSLLAFVDILQALDGFLVLGDENPDTRADGYKDDAQLVHHAFVQHETEIRAFKEWLRAQQ